jgi:hypothetical protein
METVRDLHCVWRALTSSFGVGTCAVAADHFRWGVIAQPLGDRVGLAVGQKIYYTTPL